MKGLRSYGMDEMGMNKKKRGKALDEQKKQRILESAKMVFSEKGYHKSTIAEIAARADVAHGTIYTYFPNKSALATEVIGTWGASGYIESLQKESGGALSPEEFLQVIAEKFFGRLDERLPLIRFRISEAVVNEQLGPQYYKHLINRFILHVANFCERCQEKGIFKKEDPYIQAHAFYGMLFSLMYTQELLRGKEISGLDINDAISATIELYLHGVKNS